jgi:hypothetical protein
VSSRQRQCWTGCALAVALAFAGSLSAQPPPTASEHAAAAEMAGAQAAGARIARAVLTSPQYSGLSGAEKATVTFFAFHGLLLVESGRCAQAYSEQSAVETFLLTFLTLSHDGLKPILTLPNARKTELVDTAMKLASEEAGKSDWCRGHLLPGKSVQPLSERQARARNLLMEAILAAHYVPPRPGSSTPGAR